MRATHRQPLCSGETEGLLVEDLRSEVGPVRPHLRGACRVTAALERRIGDAVLAAGCPRRTRSSVRKHALIFWTRYGA